MNLKITWREKFCLFVGIDIGVITMHVMLYISKSLGGEL
jgi:hypothetical protein